MLLTSATQSWLQPAQRVGTLLSRADTGRTAAADSGASNFAAMLGDALDGVNSAQLEGDRQAQLVATGQSQDIHTAVLAIDKAQLALQLTVAAVGRAADAYKEIAHLQI
jgi:flagellar hook-basal body complex protein FliE